MIEHFYTRIIARFLQTAGVACFLVASFLPGFSQPFESAGISFAGAGRSAVAWADYDQDHDLDVIVSGIGSGDNPVTILYRNDDGSFTDSGMPVIPVKECSASWGDYDMDGDLDLLLCGNSANGDLTRIYRNDSPGFTEIDPGLPAVQNGDAVWADIDSDGDLDIFITGNWVAGIYINDNGTFSASGQSFGYFSSSSAAFGDYDNDGDLDLLINGDSGAGAVSKIFRNDDGNFVDAEAGLSALMSGTTDWVDYDNDGDLDVAISGYDDALEAQFFLYKNNGKQFTQVFTGIEGYALGSADWGDFDLDGDLDLVMSGKATGCGAYVSGIYRNDGNDAFYKLSDVITVATRCSLEWADFDNDGDLDFIISGLNTLDAPFTKLYLNTAGTNQFESNSIPSSPKTFSSEINGSDVILSWSGASDEETDLPGLSYNVILSCEPGGCEVISPMSIYPVGTRMVTTMGNSGQTESCQVANLSPGTYYWSVQSIDQAFEGSEFSTEQSFTITATGLGNREELGSLDVFPNPSSGFVEIANPGGQALSEIRILDYSGREVFAFTSRQSKVWADISYLPAGNYIVVWTAGSQRLVKRLCKN